MKTMEIYFGDLNEEAQQTFREIFGDPEGMNLDTFPLFIYEQEEDISCQNCKKLGENVCPGGNEGDGCYQSG